jgi:uncharacterized paraquat-inducible protein A
LSQKKVYCKKCGAWVVPENGECPRCGYVFEKKNKKIVIFLIGGFAVIILLRSLL